MAILINSAQSSGKSSSLFVKYPHQNTKYVSKNGIRAIIHQERERAINTESTLNRTAVGLKMSEPRGRGKFKLFPGKVGGSHVSPSRPLKSTNIFPLEAEPHIRT